MPHFDICKDNAFPSNYQISCHFSKLCSLSTSPLQRQKNSHAA